MKEKTGAITIGFAIAIIVAIIIGIIIIVISLANINKTEQENQTENIIQNSGMSEKPTIDGQEYVSEEQGIKTNISDKLQADKTFESYKFTNIRLQTDDNGSVLLADVTTRANEKQEGKEITLKFVNNKGEELIKINAYISQISPGETKTFSVETTTDITNVYDFVIE